MARSVPNLVGRIAGLVLVVGACVYLLTCEPQRPPLGEPEATRPAKTMKVESLDQVVARSYAGRAKATDLVDLSFRVGGPLVELPIRRGEEVEAGQVLAQIDPRDFRTRLSRIESSLDEAQARLKAMRAGEREEVIRARESELTAARADLENAVVELRRAEKLLQERVLSQSDFDQAKLRHDVAAEKVTAAEQNLKQAREGARPEDIEAQEALIRGLEAQQSEAADALADTTMTAPFSGVVAKLNVENFQSVRPQQVVLSLQNVSEVDIVADIPEALLAVVRREHVRSWEVVFEAVPDRTFEVSFKEIEAEADPRTQTYALTVTMPAPEDVRILPGMTATLRVGLQSAALEGVPVPATAVFSAPDATPRVWKVDPADGSVHLVPVQVGEMAADRILVLSGLEPGDVIVTAGVHLLSEGMRVRPLPEDR